MAIFKKVGSNDHGAITQVKTDNGFHVGNIRRWHGLYIPSDWNGEDFAPRTKRQDAAAILVENFEYKLGHKLIKKENV